MGVVLGWGSGMEMVMVVMGVGIPDGGFRGTPYRPQLNVPSFSPAI